MSCHEPHCFIGLLCLRVLIACAFYLWLPADYGGEGNLASGPKYLAFSYFEGTASRGFEGRGGSAFCQLEGGLTSPLDIDYTLCIRRVRNYLGVTCLLYSRLLVP